MAYQIDHYSVKLIDVVNLAGARNCRVYSAFRGYVCHLAREPA
jgi:hypothetical protein